MSLNKLFFQKPKIRFILICFFAVFFSHSLLAQSSYPAKSIKFIVPYAPGGGTDTFARLTAQELSKVIGQNVVVDNVTGAAGMVAGSQVARSAPDGYTILVEQASKYSCKKCN